MTAPWVTAWMLIVPGAAWAGDQPPPPPIVINWDRVGAAGAGLVAGLLGMLVGGAAGSSLGCAIEHLATGDCGDLRVIPSILLGLGTGALAGYVAVELYWGELADGWPPHQPNVHALRPPTGLSMRFEF